MGRAGPSDEQPPAVEPNYANEFITVSPDVFLRFTKIPIIIYYGDNIPDSPTGRDDIDAWIVRLRLARLWAEAVNKRGGDVTVVHLPQIGIRGNTHFLFADTNSLDIAYLVAKWLHEKGLDK